MTVWPAKAKLDDPVAPDEIETGLEDLRGLVRQEAVDWGSRPYVPPRSWPKAATL